MTAIQHNLKAIVKPLVEIDINWNGVVTIELDNSFNGIAAITTLVREYLHPPILCILEGSVSLQTLQRPLYISHLSIRHPVYIDHLNIHQIRDLKHLTLDYKATGDMVAKQIVKLINNVSLEVLELVGDQTLCTLVSIISLQTARRISTLLFRKFNDFVALVESTAVLKGMPIRLEDQPLVGQLTTAEQFVTTAKEKEKEVTDIQFQSPDPVLGLSEARRIRAYLSYTFFTELSKIPGLNTLEINHPKSTQEQLALRALVEHVPRTIAVFGV